MLRRACLALPYGSAVANVNKIVVFFYQSSGGEIRRRWAVLTVQARRR